MKRHAQYFVAILLATGVTAAHAQQSPAAAQEKTTVVPGKQETQSVRPSVEKLDDTAQKAHDKDKSGQTAQAGITTSPAATQSQRSAATMAASETRDWSAIDTNKDNLIQPEEMEVALKAAWKKNKQ